MRSPERNTLLLALAWLVALVATLGSLYYSEVRNFIPCTLCWYQRIAMYPLAFLLGIALWRGDAGVRPYALTLSLLGLFWSSYHLLELWVPGLAPNVCKGPIPCNVEYLPQFPIPLQAWLAFALISLALLGVSPRRS
ncbi:MAG: disulfide bond formation protein B [Meiothermus sp.]|uniref:disulfide bond formation protein B n=1 Tax=Meiothermus sp. TaxID=1955249 RepID=UPI0025FB36DB|nr:disulfide bond formation protein B [Meiothermus sp.]MCS7059324.1 disulfide bond formation protein B [Meiothermus sp.]MCS7195133.1 disulfide bond formation protein B [Meiothermus sp.]MCX7740741.1 disulfide bond formation protein B [Meiothermus sp.]MDW8091851.1 disulfide bond formation protein B [Meiothermus sp.]MDW8482144.1 disulfide bond formation protein B [Meiothermus sp.]